MELEIEYAPDYHKVQKEIFESPGKIKVIAKGRRFGLTRGMSKYIVEKLIQGDGPILWVDTIYGNIKRYIEIYILPEIKKVKNFEKWLYEYNKTDARITMLKTFCDFRSADRPENIEGYGYRHIVINEAGIVLKE